MGLASKLNAAPGAPSGGYQQPQAPYGQSQTAPPPGPYQAYPGGTVGGPAPSQYGAPPRPSQTPQPPYSGGPPPPQTGYGQPQYGAPPSGGPVGLNGPPQEVSAYKQALERAIDEKNLRRFYPPGSPAIDMIAQRAPAKIATLSQQWRIPLEVGRDLARLGLYDIVLYIDDSGSMQFEENGERIDDLKLILQRVAQAATLFDEDGISVRFMNTQLPQGLGDHLANESQINELIHNVKFAGLTPMGRELRRKVIDDVVLRAARSNTLKKPVLVIAVTDGQPAGDDPGPTAVFDAVRYAVSEVQRATGTTGGIAFQFAQVGNDTRAREFLGKLDSDPTVGNMVDCTSNFENEQQEMLQQSPPVELTPTLWLVKLLMGAIDPSYDSKDEVRTYRPGGGALSAQQGFSQQSYGPPQGQPSYGGGPPGQIPYGNQPPGHPPYVGQPQHPQYGAQGGYGGQPQPGAPIGYAQQPSRPGQAPPQHGGYAPQQGGYGQQSGYNAPPPPPRY